MSVGQVYSTFLWCSTGVKETFTVRVVHEMPEYRSDGWNSEGNACALVLLN